MKKSNPIFNSAEFQKHLLAWYRSHARVLPWRVDTRTLSTRGRDPYAANPYHVWLSEIMLQQTVVATVIPYFNKFIKNYPDIFVLARAKEADIMRDWAGLGYYARARNLIMCAKQICDEHGGIFPSDEDTLLELKGIGAYTAAAIRAIAFNKPAIVVDGNIERIVSRVFRITEFLPAAKLILKQYAAEFYLRDKHPAEMAQALMDLGATICVPKNPRCELCPVSKFCAVAHTAEAGTYPRKKPKDVRPVRRGFTLILYTKAGDVWCETRGGHRMLGGMLGLPSSDWDQKGEDCKFDVRHAKKIGIVKHIFSHFELQMDVYAQIITKREMAVYKNSGMFVPRDGIVNAGLPSLFKKAMKVFNDEKF